MGLCRQDAPWQALRQPVPEPIYADATLVASISPALTNRRQGKSCFNFVRIDEPLFEELSSLMAHGVPGFRAVAEALDAERR